MSNIEPPGEAPRRQRQPGRTARDRATPSTTTGHRSLLLIRLLWVHSTPTRLWPGCSKLPHDELVDFFARATLNDLSEIFPTFLESDKARVIETLADINERKAAKLIDTCCVEAVLVALPEAAKAIARKAVDLRWTDAGPTERFGAGYARRYKNGRIFWDGRAGVHVTVGVIDLYSTASGPRWGVPIGDEETAPGSPFGTVGVRQGFQVGTVYSSKHGVYHVIEEQCYAGEGGGYGWLRVPCRRN